MLVIWLFWANVLHDLMNMFHNENTPALSTVLLLYILVGFSIAGPSTTPRKRQVRFSARHDIMLLRQVIVQNPFKSKETGRSWAHVGEIITAALQDENFEVDARRCRERTMLLLDYYKKQDFASLRRYRTLISLRITLVGYCILCF